MQNPTLLNVLGAVALVFVLVLRRRFQALADEPAGDHRLLRWLFAPALLAFAAFLVVGLWALMDGGYWVVALAVVVYLGLAIRGMVDPPLTPSLDGRSLGG